MFALGAEGTLLEKLQQFHIVPLTISYEYDPCDYLKAAEMQAKRDDVNWKKGAMDDAISMQTGIFGYKGSIHYHAAPCIDDYLEALKSKSNISNGDLLDTICLHIDKQIHRNYYLYANNYIALDELEGTTTYADKYTDADKAKFDAYLKQQLAKIEIVNKDEEYLRRRMLEMYANPTRNYLKGKCVDIYYSALLLLSYWLVVPTTLLKLGDSEYSYLRSDFVEATTNNTSVIVSAITDDGDTLLLSPSLRVKWVEKADTTYRAQFILQKERCKH